MNKILLLFLSLAAAFVLSGCLQISAGYTGDADFPADYNGRKYAVTFSVDYLSDGNADTGRAGQEKYVAWLKEDLRKTGAFSSVNYKAFAEKSKYHIHFLIHYSAMPVDKAAALDELMACSLYLIPVRVDSYLDASAILYLNGSAICSPATSEALRSYVWLPFVPVGMVWNPWMAWTAVEKKCYRYLINEITDHQRRFLQ